jgi:hypothetical protein
MIEVARIEGKIFETMRKPKPMPSAATPASVTSLLWSRARLRTAAQSGYGWLNPLAESPFA